MKETKENRIILGKNALFNILRVLFNLVLPVLVFPYVSRRLGPANLGMVDFATAVVSYFLMFATMGIPVYGRIACAKVRNQEQRLQKTVCELMYIGLLLDAVTILTLLLAVFLVPRFHAYRVLLLLNGLTVLVSAVSLEWLHGALERYQYIALRTMGLKLLSVALIFLLVHSPQDAVLYTAINVLVQVLTAFMDLALVRKHVRFFPLKELNLRRHFTPVLMFFTSSVAVTIAAHTDTVMLNLISGEYHTGLYTFSARIKSMLLALMSAGLDVVIPRLSLAYHEGRHRDFRTLLRTVGLFTFVVACAMWAFFTAFSWEAVNILGSAAYESAAAIVMALVLSLPVLSFNFTLGIGVLHTIGRERLYARTMLISCLVNIIANLLLIPRFQGVGAAAATLVSETVNLALYYRYSRDYLKDTFSHSRCLPILAAAVAAGALCYVGKAYLLPGQPLWQMLVFLIVYLIIYCPLVLLISKDARQFVNNMLKERER